MTSVDHRPSHTYDQIQNHINPIDHARSRQSKYHKTLAIERVTPADRIQIQHLHRRFALGALNYAIGTAILTLLIIGYGMTGSTFAWLVIMASALVGNLYLWARAQNTLFPSPSQNDLRTTTMMLKWRDDHTAALAITSLAWGAAGFLLVPHLPFGVLAPAVIVLTLITVVGALLSAAHIPSTLAATIPAMALICMALLTKLGSTGEEFALFAALAGGLALLLASGLNQFIKETW